MTPAERYAWLKNWFAQGGQKTFGDVLDSDLVDAYIKATGSDAKATPFGAPKCPQLGRDLSAMFASGALVRERVGMPAGDASMGFPKWVYSYHLKE